MIFPFSGFGVGAQLTVGLAQPVLSCVNGRYAYLPKKNESVDDNDLPVLELVAAEAIFKELMTEDTKSAPVYAIKKGLTIAGLVLTTLAGLVSQIDLNKKELSPVLGLVPMVSVIVYGLSKSILGSSYFDYYNKEKEILKNVHLVQELKRYRGELNLDNLVETCTIFQKDRKDASDTNSVWNQK